MKEFIELMKKIYQNPKGKSAYFFLFYFFFFLILIIFMKSNHGVVRTKDNYEKGKSYSFSTRFLTNKNYEFSYEFVKDGEKSVFAGKKNQNQESFTYQDKEYYGDTGSYYVKDQQWVSVEKPYMFAEFLDEDDLVSIIHASSFVSKTSYESGKTTYNFLISSNTINQLLYGISSDFMEEPNQLIISTNDRNEIENIHFSLNSYCTLNKLCNKSLDIDLSYSKFGKVKKIENPIS